MALTDGITNLRTLEPSTAVDQAIATATTGVAQAGGTQVADQLDAFSEASNTQFAAIPSDSRVSEAASFSSPLESTAILNSPLRSFITDASFPFQNVLTDLAVNLTPGVVTQALPAPTTKSGEDVISEKTAELSTRIDDLMKEAANLDLSTAEGQKRLAEIQLEFSQISRLMTALSEMLKKFDDLNQQIISNF